MRVSWRRSSISPAKTAATADRSRATGPPVLAGTPAGLLMVLAGALVCSWGLNAAGVIPRSALAAVVVTAAHGGMLGTAIGWAACAERGRVHGDGPPLAPSPGIAVAVIALAAALASVHPRGALGYLAVLAWVAWHARRGRFTALGLGTPVPRGPLVLGLLGGAFLGVHLLVSASLTLGYQPGAVDAERALGAIAYDAGLQVVATESFFRGALFNRLQRRWSFAGAATVSSAASVMRYLVDPLLPGSIELVVGAVFYITLLSVMGAWLYWRSGSLVPAYLASLAFFLAYRCLGVR
jgi:membrane protease YdiL (CAAX protease family)